MSLYPVKEFKQPNGKVTWTRTVPVRDQEDNCFYYILISTEGIGLETTGYGWFPWEKVPYDPQRVPEYTDRELEQLALKTIEEFKKQRK
jgi:hypothetical protein